jgi:DNA-directed RNA polymerase subunit alpha
VYYKKGKVETISHVIKVEVLGTYTLVPKPIPANEEEHTEYYKQLSPKIKELLSQKVDELDLSVRTRNILEANGIDTILDLCRLQKTDFLKFRNAGKKSLMELEDFLTAHNLTWEMNV